MLISICTTNPKSVSTICTPPCNNTSQGFEYSNPITVTFYLGVRWEKLKEEKDLEKGEEEGKKVDVLNMEVSD